MVSLAWARARPGTVSGTRRSGNLPCPLTKLSAAILIIRPEYGSAAAPREVEKASYIHNPFYSTIHFKLTYMSA